MRDNVTGRRKLAVNMGVYGDWRPLVAIRGTAVLSTCKQSIISPVFIIFIFLNMVIISPNGVTVMDCGF